MGWALRFLRQTGTRDELGCNFPYAVISSMEAGNLGPHASSVSTWTHIQWPWMSVLPWMFIVQNGGMVTLCVVWTYPWMSSRWNPLGAVGSGAPEGVAPHSTPAPLHIFGAAGVTLRWSHQNGPASRSWLLLLVSLTWSFPMPYQKFLIPPWLVPFQHWSWLVSPGARYHCYNLLYWEHVNWPQYTLGKGWLNLWYLPVPATCLATCLKDICSQHPELTLETCTPRLINAVTFCLTMMMGVSLDHPTR